MLRLLTFVCLLVTFLAGCNSNPLIVEISDCPGVGFVRYANTITVFDPPESVSADRIAYQAYMSGLEVDCQDRGEGVRTKINFLVTAEQDEAYTGQSVTLPYFVVIARRGDDMQSKSNYSLTLDLSDNKGRATQVETLEFTIPTNDLADSYLYEVLIGFELTNLQAKFNLDS